jgi:hypothetical protein
VTALSRSPRTVAARRGSVVTLVPSSSDLSWPIAAGPTPPSWCTFSCGLAGADPGAFGESAERLRAPVGAAAFSARSWSACGCIEQGRRWRDRTHGREARRATILGHDRARRCGDRRSDHGARRGLARGEAVASCGMPDRRIPRARERRGRSRRALAHRYLGRRTTTRWTRTAQDAHSGEASELRVLRGARRSRAAFPRWPRVPGERHGWRSSDAQINPPGA